MARNHGGPKQVIRMLREAELERENARLEKIVAEKTLRLFVLPR